MKEYIEREEALVIAKILVHIAYTRTEKIKDTEIEKAINDIPAAGVVEVDVKDLRIKKAIQTLCEFYSTAKKSDYVQKPLAWALYQTWKTFDKMDGGVNNGRD